jgi:hypothetical protein
MDAKQFIKKQVRRILYEEEEGARDATSYEQTTRIGGGIKKELRNLKALADDNPSELMKRLSINDVTGQTPSLILFDLLNKAINNSKEMRASYTSPGKERDTFGRDAARIDLTGELDARDGVIFIRHTIRGARNAGVLPFKDRIQIELLGGSILTYPDPMGYSWNAGPRKTKKPVKKQQQPSPKTQQLVGVQQKEKK